MCATHGVTLLSLLHSLCIPLFLLFFLRGIIGKNNRENQALTGLMDKMLRKLLRQVDENKGALAGNQQSWEMLCAACAALQGQRNQLRFML